MPTTTTFLRLPSALFVLAILGAALTGLPAEASAQAETADDEAAAAEETAPARPSGGPQEAFALLGSPNQLALRDVMRRGTSGSFGLGYVGELQSDPDYLLRGSFNLELGILDDHLRFGLLFPVDFEHQERTRIEDDTQIVTVPSFHRRGGANDVRVSAGWTFLDGPDTAAHADLAVWIPSGREPHGLRITRFVPSLEAQHRTGRLILRGRVGAILDADADRDLWVAGAAGVDYLVLGSWTVGLELDAFGGASDREGVGGLGIGVGTAVEVTDWLRLTGGIRVAPGTDFEDRLGPFNVVVAARVVDLRP